MDPAPMATMDGVRTSVSRGAVRAMADEFSAKRNQTGAPRPDPPPAQAGDRATGLSPAVWATGLILIAVVLLVVFGA